MKYTLLRHLHYSLWANGKLAEFIAKADENVFDTEVKSSFPSLKKTVLHIWDAEYIWLRRLQGESLKEYPSKNFTGNRAEALKGFTDNSKALLDYVAAQPAEYGNTSITFKNLKGDEFTNTVEEILMHVVNHGTFHRGQLVTILRTLGFTEVSSTDLITYMRIA